MRYGTEFIRTRISFDAGSSTLKGGNVDESNPVVRANVAHRISPSLSFFGDYAQEFAASDAGIYVPPLATGPATGAITSILTGGPRTIKSYRGGMIFKRPRTTVEIGLSRYDEASLGPLPLTRATDEFLAKATRLITPRSHGTAYGKYSDDKSSTQLFQSKGYQVGIEYGLLFDKLLGINCRVEHAQRTSPTLSSNYTETSIGLFVTYGRAISADRQ